MKVNAEKKRPLVEAHFFPGSSTMEQVTQLQIQTQQTQLQPKMLSKIRQLLEQHLLHQQVRFFFREIVEFTIFLLRIFSRNFSFSFQ